VCIEDGRLDVKMRGRNSSGSTPVARAWTSSIASLSWTSKPLANQPSFPTTASNSARVRGPSRSAARSFLPARRASAMFTFGATRRYHARVGFRIASIHGQ
jgi:hypothetical protein